MDYGRVVAAFYFYYRLSAGGKIHGLLRQCDRRRRLYGSPEDKGHSVGDAAVRSAAVVCFCGYSAAARGQPVVCFAAGHVRKREACSEFHALNGRNREQNVSKFALHAVEPGLAKAGFQPADRGLQNSSKGISCGLYVFYLFNHSACSIRVQNREGCRLEQLNIFRRIFRKRSVRYPVEP